MVSRFLAVLQHGTLRDAVFRLWLGAGQPLRFFAALGAQILARETHLARITALASLLRQRICPIWADEFWPPLPNRALNFHEFKHQKRQFPETSEEVQDLFTGFRESLVLPPNWPPQAYRGYRCQRLRHLSRDSVPVKRQRCRTFALHGRTTLPALTESIFRYPRRRDLGPVLRNVAHSRDAIYVAFTCSGLPICDFTPLHCLRIAKHQARTAKNVSRPKKSESFVTGFARAPPDEIRRTAGSAK